MPEQLTHSARALQVKTSDLIRDVLLPAEARLAEGTDSGAIRHEVIEAATEAGLFTMTQPEAYSGITVSALELTVVRETLAAANLRVSA